MDLTIVHDSKTSAIAHQLHAIISTIPECRSRVFTEKNWNDNKATISSENHVLFIGNIADGIALKPIIKWKYENINMKYGWIGKQALMIVEKHTFRKEELEELKKKFEKEQLNSTNIDTNIGINMGISAGSAFLFSLISSGIGLITLGISGVALAVINNKGADKIYQAEYGYMINLLCGTRREDFNDFIGKGTSDEDKINILKKKII